MSNERTNHAALALRIVESDRDSEFGWETTDAQHLANLAEAQVHATLALVEQQRIANLIAVAMWNSRALVEGARHVGDKPVDLQTEVDRVDAMFAEVHDGLGL